MSFRDIQSERVKVWRAWSVRCVLWWPLFESGISSARGFRDACLNHGSAINPWSSWCHPMSVCVSLPPWCLCGTCEDACRGWRWLVRLAISGGGRDLPLCLYRMDGRLFLSGFWWVGVLLPVGPDSFCSGSNDVGLQTKYSTSSHQANFVQLVPPPL